MENVNLGRNEKYGERVDLKTTIYNLRQIIYESKERGIIKRNTINRRISAMLCRLDSQCEIGTGGFVPRKINSIEDLYLFSPEEIKEDFWGYKEKTWRGLNEILKHFNLPSIDLPEEYIENS